LSHRVHIDKTQTRTGAVAVVEQARHLLYSGAAVGSSGTLKLVMRSLGCDCQPLGKTPALPGFVFPPRLDTSLAGWVACLALSLALAREHGGGVEEALVAEAAGMSTHHVHNAMRHLQSDGFVDRRTVTIPWYYGTREARLWIEKPRPELLGVEFPRFVGRGVAPDRLPPQFWWLFWSGLDPMLIRLPEHARYVASRMITFDDRRRNLPAETWALKHLPGWALRKLLNDPAFEDTPVADRIEFALKTNR